MATTGTDLQPVEEYRDKGLKGGALGLVSSVVMGVASTAPAYSLAATLVFVVVAVGLKAPAVALLAFIPMLLCSIGYSEMNKADPDCGTTFTWATRAFGPKTGWAGGWAIVAADILVMASLAQVAGQYMFLLFQGPNSAIGQQPGQRLGAAGRHQLDRRDDLHLLPRHRGLGLVPERILLTIEIVMLLVLAIVALVKVAPGSHPPPTAIHAERRLAAAHRTCRSRRFVGGIILMLFIYWGWDTAVSVNEETADKARTPGPGGDHLDRDAAGHLRRGDLRGAVVRRHRHQGHRPGQPGARVRRAVGARRRGLRRPAASARSCPGC